MGVDFFCVTPQPEEPLAGAPSKALLESHGMKLPWIVSKLFQLGFGFAKLLLTAPPPPGALPDLRDVEGPDVSPYKITEANLERGGGGRFGGAWL